MHSEVYQGVVEQDSVPLEEISSMASDFLSSVWVVSSQGFQYLMVIESTSLVGDFNVWEFSPCLHNFIVIFVVINLDGIMDNVTDLVDLCVDFV
jgi:hypothetical protein